MKSKIFMFLLMLLCLSKNAEAAFPQGEVKYTPVKINRVVDGDTFIANETKFKLFGIDAPKEKDAGFLAAKLYLEVLLDPKNQIECKYLYQDSLGRLVVKCNSDGQDVGSDMVYFGMAKINKENRDYYSSEELDSKSAHRGIWHKN